MTVEELKVIISTEMKGFNTTIKGVKGSLKSVNKAASKTEKALQNALQIKTSNLTREYDTFSKTFSVSCFYYISMIHFFQHFST